MFTIPIYDVKQNRDLHRSKPDVERPRTREATVIGLAGGLHGTKIFRCERSVNIDLNLETA